MKCDLHFHAASSKETVFDPVFFMLSIYAAQDVGLDALALINHFNAPDFEGMFTYLDQHYEYRNGFYDVLGIKVFPGMEVCVCEGPHYVVLGTRECVLEFHHRLSYHLLPEFYCSTRVFFRKQQDLRLYNIFAHPFRPEREISRIDSEFYPYFDALELNARDMFMFGNEIRIATMKAGRQLNLPVVAGGDSIQFHQLGSIYNDFRWNINTMNEFRIHISNQQYKIFINEMLEAYDASARQEKDAMIEAVLALADC